MHLRSRAVAKLRSRTFVHQHGFCRDPARSCLPRLSSAQLYPHSSFTRPTISIHPATSKFLKASLQSSRYLSTGMPKASSSDNVRRGNRPSDQKTGEKGTPMTPIPSASLIVLAPTISNGKTEYDTVMLQRTARDGSSFKSAVVFPGGALDLADEAPFLSSRSGRRFTPDEIVKATPLTLETDGVRYMEALKLCALRETFEELGLLLIPSQHSEGSQQGPPRSRAVGHKSLGMTEKEWADMREEIHNDASKFPAFLRRVAKAVGAPGASSDEPHAIPPLAAMAHHSNWITPRSVVRPGKRFDAQFFITVLDEPDIFRKGTDPNPKSEGLIDVSADGLETTSLQIAPPRQLIDDAMKDRFVLFPPQFYILADLAAALADGKGTESIVPLNFAGPPSRDQLPAATPVEEEARNLQGRNYTWDKQTPSKGNTGPSKAPLTSWVSYTEPPFVTDKDGTVRAAFVTAVEPRPLPSAGANVSMPVRNASGQWERKSEDEPFLFPLCLPGDRDQSKVQARQAGLTYQGSKDEDDLAVSGPINRIYASPRSKADGGGLVVVGIQRKGVGSLRDLKFGTVVGEEGAKPKL